jgi:hypothetical protein
MYVLYAREVPEGMYLYYVSQLSLLYSVQNCLFH